MEEKIIILMFSVLLFSIFYASIFSLTSPEFLGIVKPITIIQYSGFLLFAFILNEVYTKYNSWFKERKVTLVTIGFFFLMATLYESIWTFHYWFSLYSLYGIDTDLDEIEFHPIEGRTSYPYNMNVNSKHFWLWTFCSFYFVIKVGELI